MGHLATERPFLLLIKFDHLRSNLNLVHLTSSPSQPHKTQSVGELHIILILPLVKFQISFSSIIRIIARRFKTTKYVNAH